jgi:hypothetical protein
MKARAKMCELSELSLLLFPDEHPPVRGFAPRLD